MNDKLTSFTQLKVWQKSHSLVLFIYELSESFPPEEAFGLTGQLRRSALSITSNIAEGFGRKSEKEKQRFYYIAKGSVTELQNQTILASDLNYIKYDDFQQTQIKSVEILKMLNKLISSIS